MKKRDTNTFGKMKARARAFHSPLLGSIAALLLGAASPVLAGNIQWLPTPLSGDWNTANNWTPATVPNGVADVATFGISNLTKISLSSAASVDGVIFNSGASAFTITSGSSGATLTINGAGIINNSGITQNFVTMGAGAILFNGSASAGSNTTFTNNGGTSSTGSGGATLFRGTSTAGSSTLIANGGTNGGSGGVIAFLNDSLGGTATVKVFGNGNLDIGLHNSPGVTIGSLEGTGDVFLGGNKLIVGSNNVSTVFSGVIQDGSGSSGGSLSKTGTGTLTLTGANTYTGATTVAAGTLQFGLRTAFYNATPASWTPANLTVSSGATAAFNVGGPGEFTSTDIDTLKGLSIPVTTTTGGTTTGGTTTGGTTTGGTTTGGTTTGGTTTTTTGITGGFQSGSFLGLDTTNATNGVFTYAGSIPDFNAGANSLGLVKLGSGSLILTGTNTYTGNTIVNAGALIINGSIASSKTIINSGGALLGRGTVGGDVANNGFVMPGDIPLGNISLQSLLAASAGKSINLNVANLPATQLALTVKGNYTQNAQGTLVIAYGGPAATQHNSLNVQGKATLGGNLRLVQVNGARLNVGESVPIVTATGGVTGKFATVTDAPLINANVIYQANSVVLETSQGLVTSTLTGVHGISGNDLAVASALDSAAGDPRAAHLFTVLNTDTATQLAKDVQHINPEQLTATSGVANSVSGVHNSNVQLRMAALRAGVTGFSAMGYHTADNPSDFSSGLAGPSGPDGKSGKEIVPPPPDNRWGSFITGSGQFNHVGDTESARGFNLDSGGITLGADYRFTDHFVAGIFFGYTYTGIDLSGGGRITADAGKVGLYSTYFNGGFHVDTAVQGGYSGYESNRNGLNGTAHGSPHGGDFNLLFAPGYDWTFGALTIGPTASFQYSYQGTNGFTETGSDAPLSVSSQHSTSLITTVGMKASYDWKIGSTIIRPEVRASWQHEYGDITSSVNSQLASGAGDSFRVTGPEIGRDSMLVGAGFTVVWSDRFSTYAFYDGEFFRTNYDSSTVTGGFRFLF